MYSITKPRLEGKRTQGFHLFAIALLFEEVPLKKKRFHLVFQWQRPEKSVGFPGAVSIRSCKLPDMGVGNRTVALRKYTKHF